MDIIPPTAPIFLTCDTTISSYVLIVDAYFKIPKDYVTEKISTEEVMGKLDMFQIWIGTYLSYPSLLQWKFSP